MTLAIPRTSLRPRLRTGDALLYAATAALALSLGAGCATTGGRGRARPPTGVVEPNQVADDRFAESVHTLLRDGNPTKERQALLEGVVRRQLAHAADRLKAKQRDRGMASVVGALYLVRAGELRAEMIDPVGDQALAGAIDVVAATGDEGRSMALYDLRKLSLPPASPARKDAEEHLAALDKWVNDIAQSGQVGPTEAAGLAQRRMTARALLFPSDEALKEAVQSTSRWVDAGIRFQQDFRTARERPKREEAVEGFRAVSSGAATLAALFLRSGDAQGAVEAISSTSVEQVTPPGLFMRLNAATKPKDAAAWRDLLQLFGRPESRDEETAVDRALLQAATFGVAIEAYRREPTSVEITMVLASALNAYGMPEAAPPVLADAAKKHPEAPVVSSMLDVVSRSIAQEEEDEDPASALRTFAASSPLLEIADATKGKMAVTPARFRLVAAGVSARAGELATARGLLGLALKDGASPEALRLAADVERQLGNAQAALDRLGELAVSPDARRDRVLEAEARLLSSDVHREMGARDKAREQVVLALTAATDGRKLAQQPAQVARAERTLARVLERVGDDAGAARATERALTASRGDARELGPTVLEAVARAFVAKDLPAARRAAKAAVGSGLRDDEIVYVGIWLQLLERELSAKTDGTAALAFAEVAPNSGWASKLSGWATGKLADVDLAAAARTPAQRTEASFYRAVAQRVSGETAAADSSLREVARASVVELVESQIARDLLAGDDRRLPGPSPVGLAPR